MSDRIIGYDIARSVAVLGMIFVNYWIVLGAPTGSLSWMIVMLEGKAAATFVVLAGVGLTLLSHQGTKNKGSISRRGLFLFLFGLLFSTIWPADILHFYGVYLTLSLLILSGSPVILLITYMTTTVLFIPLVILIDYGAGWEFESLNYVDFWTTRGMIRHLFYNGFHPVVPWFAFIVAGIWLGRQDLEVPEVRWKIVIVAFLLIVVAAVVELVMPQELAFSTAPMPPFPLFVVMGTGVAFLVITTCVSLSQRYSLMPLVHTGQMSLTIYVAHIVVGLGLLEVVGMQTMSFHGVVAYSISFFVGSVCFSHIWIKRYGRGPLEKLMRILTS